MGGIRVDGGIILSAVQASSFEVVHCFDFPCMASRFNVLPKKSTDRSITFWISFSYTQSFNLCLSLPCFPWGSWIFLFALFSESFLGCGIPLLRSVLRWNCTGNNVNFHWSRHPNYKLLSVSSKINVLWMNNKIIVDLVFQGHDMKNYVGLGRYPHPSSASVDKHPPILP